MLYVKVYLAMLVSFFAIDIVWLGLVARGFYKKQLDFLLAPTPNWPVAIAFYLLFIAGMLVFVVSPSLQAGSWKKHWANKHPKSSRRNTTSKSSSDTLHRKGPEMAKLRRRVLRPAESNSAQNARRILRMEKKREQQSMESQQEEESYTERLLKAKEQAKRRKK